ncbi:MAG: GntR family transcriptional regulator [Treponema sp.]|nr:GntR family transcriptional regulator [Treponema sp.]
MPKLVYQNFYRALRRDIETNYKPDDRYLKVREIAGKFNVSLQIAQKAVSQLEQEGVISAKQRAGIIIRNTLSAPSGLDGKKIIVLSYKQDYHFYASFLDGIKQNCGRYNVEVEFKMNTFKETDSLNFGKYLLSLNADGIITLSFVNSALPFYYALREGQDIVADIILDSLPVLPAVQTDNYKHSYEAAAILSRQNCRRYFVLGYYPQNNRRYKGFYDGIQKTWKGAFRPEVTYIQLSKMNVVGEVLRVIHNYSDTAGFFISDYSANYFFGLLCIQEHIQPRTVLVYDADDSYFLLPGLEPVRSIGPSFKELGRQLSDVLIRKWKTGTYPEPLQRKI